MSDQEVRVTHASNGSPATREEMNDAAARKFLEAAKLIETALVLLDTRHELCGGCGLKHYTNLAHMTAYKKLTDTPHRLRTCAESIVMSEEKPVNRRRQRRG